MLDAPANCQRAGRQCYPAAEASATDRSITISFLLSEANILISP
jgi:hypothetical protein